MQQMKGKVALVAGGVPVSGGQRPAFARAGVRMVLAARGAERGTEVEREIRGGTATFIRADVSSDAEVEG